MNQTKTLGVWNMSDGTIARTRLRVDYYVWNTLQGVAIATSGGGSGLYWAFLMTQATGENFDTFTGRLSFLVAMGIMTTLEGYKALQQRKDGENRDKLFKYFVLFSISTGVALLMINAERVGDNRTKNSSVYQQAELQNKKADDEIKKYAWAEGVDIEEVKREIDAYKATIAKRGDGKSSGLTIGAVLSNPAKYPSYQHYQQELDDLQEIITAKRAYDSAVSAKGKALQTMTENAQGASSTKAEEGEAVTGINAKFDWFINTSAGLVNIEPMTFLILFYTFAIWLLERAGVGAGREAFYAGVAYHKGKQEAQDLRDIARFGYIPRHLGEQATSLATENARLRQQLAGAGTVNYQSAPQPRQQEQEENLEERANRHAQEGSGKPELTAVMEAFEEKIQHLNKEAQERVKKAVQEQAEKWTKEKAKSAYGMAYFSGINIQAPYPPPSVDVGKIGGFPTQENFVPKKENGFPVQEKPIFLNRKKNSDNFPKQEKEKHPKNVDIKTSKRKSVTPDTGTKGKNANRYRAIIKAIEEGKITPNYTGVKGFKYGGRGMGTATAQKYVEALKYDGIIKK